MRQTYYKTLPTNYFDNLYARVADKLTHGQNVCISVIRGGGARTAFNFLYNLLEQNKLFDEIYIYDPEIEDIEIIKFIKNLNTKSGKQKLVIVRSFEIFKERPKLLSKIDSLRRQSPESLTTMGIADFTAATNPNDYQSTTAIFFSSIIYIPPFDQKNTFKMIGTLEKFFGWKVDKNLYQNIHKLSGGLPRVTKYIIRNLAEDFGEIGNEECFLKIPQINFQMEKMSKIIITLPTYQLVNLGLLDGKGHLKSKLLKTYLSKYNSIIIKDLFPTLTNTESKILSYLFENQNNVLSVNKIAELVNMTDEKFSLWAIYKTISRLRPKIRKNFKIKSIKGKGYILEKVTS